MIPPRRTRRRKLRAGAPASIDCPPSTVSVVVESFPPQVGAGCRILVLGTVPSLRSLEMRQSFAHPHNLFWPFMAELFDAGPELPYVERVARLHAAGVGIWDVLRQCERPGSLDSAIRVATEVANDIPALLAAHPAIATIALNGAKAHQVFRRRIAPVIEPQRLNRIEILPLPSTSPANASMSRALKLERWCVLRERARSSDLSAAP